MKIIFMHGNLWGQNIQKLFHPWLKKRENKNEKNTEYQQGNNQ